MSKRFILWLTENVAKTNFNFQCEAWILLIVSSVTRACRGYCNKINFKVQEPERLMGILVHQGGATKSLEEQSAVSFVR